jgi:hypothetical protein
MGPRRLSAKGARTFRQRPTLPQGRPSSTIGAGGLNFCVRNGYRCDPSAIATETSLRSDRSEHEIRHPAWGQTPVLPRVSPDERFADHESQVRDTVTTQRIGREETFSQIMAKPHG